MDSKKQQKYHGEMHSNSEIHDFDPRGYPRLSRVGRGEAYYTYDKDGNSCYATVRGTTQLLYRQRDPAADPPNEKTRFYLTQEYPSEAITGGLH